MGLVIAIILFLAIPYAIMLFVSTGAYSYLSIRNDRYERLRPPSAGSYHRYCPKHTKKHRRKGIFIAVVNPEDCDICNVPIIQSVQEDDFDDAG